MYIKNRMTANPYTIEKSASVTDVVALMHEKGLRRVPVVDNGKVAGIVTKSDIAAVSPTKATTLSIYEVNYLLSKTIVKDVMTRKVITVSPNSLLEEAAVLMRNNKISCLVVADDNEKVVGIITESDIFDAFIELFGMNKKGTRISIAVTDKAGILADIAAMFSRHNANITNMVVDNAGSGNKVEILIKTSSLNTNEIEKEISEAGYEILDSVETSQE